MSTSEQTHVLIVGAGPTGLSTALSLLNQGFHDFLIVEETSSKGPASRAITIHAATLEALDSIHCADPLVDLGIKGEGMEVSDRSSTFLAATFSSLAPYTRFPFVLLLSQSTTEEVLEARLLKLGVSILKSEKVVGLKSKDDGSVQVLFESGKVISTRYVVGADGARSTIRHLVNIGFTDPDGMPVDEQLNQMILADVVFSSDSIVLPKNTVQGTTSAGRVFLTVPLPKSAESDESVYRIGFNVPISSGPLPSSPSTVYLQQFLNDQGPVQLSSDPSINPNPIYISKTIWATRFRTHAAIADKFLVHIPPDISDSTRRTAVILVGDAAHIHAPAGGLGMNLGIRDGIDLGVALSAHLKSPNEDNGVLEEYTSIRRRRALSTIRLTKRIMYVIGALGATRFLNISYWGIRLLALIPFLRRLVAWNLSGLGNR
ncbi:hypothetical protein BDZ94DRAFT_1307682 [Collybia nuda]|uniref:FAD-binding domain-containing protein n=1 Tax=Collybia nuda TaxID=64659 RepID=A0A9P6CG48_9AGAR|nr:hypothetical protein BDZ94DRAFT_1307682 [Collybia nuda]